MNHFYPTFQYLDLLTQINAFQLFTCTTFFSSAPTPVINIDCSLIIEIEAFMTAKSKKKPMHFCLGDFIIINHYYIKSFRHEILFDLVS